MLLHNMNTLVYVHTPVSPKFDCNRRIYVSAADCVVLVPPCYISAFYFVYRLSVVSKIPISQNSKRHGTKSTHSHTFTVYFYRKCWIKAKQRWRKLNTYANKCIVCLLGGCRIHDLYKNVFFSFRFLWNFYSISTLAWEFVNCATWAGVTHWFINWKQPKNSTQND